MRLNVSTKHTSKNIELILETLQSTPQYFTEWCDIYSSSQLTTALGNEERSIKGELIHLINCETITSDKIYKALLTNQPFFEALHPEQHLGKLISYDPFTVVELSNYFTTRRQMLFEVLQNLKDTQWDKVIQEANKKRRESVYLLSHSLAIHEYEHIVELKFKIKQIFTVNSESSTSHEENYR